MTCKEDNCSRPHHGKGWCMTHYRRFLRHGDATFDRKPGRPKKVAV